MTRKSIIVILRGRPGWPTIDTAATPSFLWFTAIQDVERKQDLSSLAPKCSLISAKAVEPVIGQIGKTQKATREPDARTDSRSDRIRLRPRQGFFCVRNVVRCRIAIVTDRVSPPKHRIDDVSRSRKNLADLPETIQMDFEQAGLHGRGAAQPHNRLANRNTNSRSTAD
jgi:hypothetical protein